jgi:hypothetical protein
VSTVPRVAHLQRVLRQWVRLVCAMTLVALAAPAALGASLGPILRELAESTAHVCKCGMPVGKCGCPACERTEQQRLSEHRTEAAPTLKRHCDDDAPAMPLGAALPAGVLAASSDATLTIPRGDRIAVATTTTTGYVTDHPPPTPPPRIASV